MIIDWQRYDRTQSYEWNYSEMPPPYAWNVQEVPPHWKAADSPDAPNLPGPAFRFCGLPVDSPLGIAAGPLLHGGWCLYYAHFGFSVLTYKTVRSREHPCFPMPNLQPVVCGSLFGGESELPASHLTTDSWAVSFGMPSKSPDIWRVDVARTRRSLRAGKLLVVSVVGSVQPDWSLDDLAADYALCARWAVESGADCVEANFSCPNVSTCDGQLYQQPSDAALVAARIREAIGSVPLIIKVGRLASPDEAAALLDAVTPFATALAMTNSIAATVLAFNYHVPYYSVETPEGTKRAYFAKPGGPHAYSQLLSEKPEGHHRDGELMFDGQPRGICGAAIFEASLAQTRMMAGLIRDRGLATQLIGVGGASSAEHVRAYLAAGAHAVHIATAAMLDPGVGLAIRKELAQESK